MPAVASLMSRDLLTVEPATPLVEAARLMDERGVGAVLVLDGAQLAGICTERDVLRAVSRGHVEHATVADWMTRQPEAIDPTASAEHAAVLMLHGGFRHLPVVDGGEVVGVLSIRDLMRIVLEDSAPRGV